MHNLAVLTKIRMILCAENTIIFKILTETTLLQTCAQVLSLLVEDQDVHCMKLEALWILINCA